MKWLAVVVALAEPVAADPTPFDRGKFGLSLGAGAQTENDVRYIIVGAGVGYFLLDGIEVGLAAQHDFAEDDGPAISIVTPSLRYVAQPLVGKFPLIPYIGAFYDHYFISGFPDLDGVGVRAGALYLSGRLVFGLGVAVERTVSTCTVDCTSIYPDVTLGFAL